MPAARWPRGSALASRSPAQAFVEYGLLLVVVILAMLIGLNLFLGGVNSYMARNEPTPNPTVLANLPNHVVSVNVSCQVPLQPPAPAIFTGTTLNCGVMVTDITTIEPATL